MHFVNKLSDSVMWLCQSVIYCVLTHQLNQHIRPERTPSRGPPVCSEWANQTQQDDTDKDSNIWCLSDRLGGLRCISHHMDWTLSSSDRGEALHGELPSYHGGRRGPPDVPPADTGQTASFIVWDQVWRWEDHGTQCTFRASSSVKESLYRWFSTPTSSVCSCYWCLFADAMKDMGLFCHSPKFNFGYQRLSRSL